MRFIRGETLQDAITVFHAAETPARHPSERSLALHELLNRFVSICNTVAYAHSRGILHRDLKPRNVMLGKYDETLVVDWGLAKPFDRDESAHSVGEETLTPISGSGSGTPTVGVVGTPAYMSPEQAKAPRETVGPASDIFALGGILYAILTGQAPYQGRSVHQVLEQVQRCEFPAPRQVKPGLPRGLEAICLKAMAPRPEKRYPTALELAADVRRWLADEPVTAWREPWTIGARRWMRRHRTLVTSTAAVLIFGLAALAGFATVLAGKNRTLDARNLQLAGKNQELADKNRELDQQRQRAEQREELAIEAVSRFHDAVTANRELKNHAELDDLRKALLKEPMEFFRKLRDQLQADRDTRPQALAKLAAANHDLAKTTAEIGSIPDAIQSYSEAIAIRERVLGEHPTASGVQFDLAKSYNNLGGLLYTTGQPAQALESFRRALAIKERMARDHPTDAAFQRDLAASHINLAVLMSETGQPAQALESLKQAMKIQQRLVHDHPAVTQYQSDLATSHSNLGIQLSNNGQTAQALESHRQALALRQRLVRDEPAVADHWLDLASSHLSIAILLNDAGRTAEALEPCRQAVAIYERLARENPAVTYCQSELARSHINLGNFLSETGQPAQAQESYQQALAIWERLARANPTVTEYQRGLVHGHNSLGALQSDRARPAEARESYRRALVICERLARDYPSLHEFQNVLGSTLGNLAETEIAQGQWRQARPLLERAIELQHKAMAAMPGDPFYQESLRSHLTDLARTHQALRQPAQAIRAARQSAALARGNPKSLYKVACVLALVVPLVQGEDRQALAAEAVQTLRGAIAAGWSDARKASRDPDLNPLRDREDFQRLLAELFDRGFPADPFAH
jgi:serine/threonine-protein kinase